MIEHRLRMLLIFNLCLLLLTACAPPPTPDPADASRRVEATAIVKTQLAELVEIAASAANQQPYLPALPTAAFTPLPASETPVGEITPTNTAPIIQPTAEPVIPPPPAQTQPGEGLACYRAQFVTDVTISDNTAVQPGQNFTKTWRFVNAGSCPWLADTRPIHVDGAGLQGIPISVGRTVEPGGTADVSVQLIAPTEPGTYRGLWMLAAGGERFGLGEHGGEPFWVQIQVTPPARGVAYKFAEHVCEAFWNSAAGALPCPGEAGQPAGFVLTQGTPDLENRPEDELGLWTSPNDGEGGWISGTFPPYTVQPGDHFISDAGCLSGYPQCNVDFTLSYRPTSDQSQLIQLGAWHEVYDGNIQRIDFDLSSLAGQEIRLILAVAGHGPPGQNAAFWLVPSIRR